MVYVTTRKRKDRKKRQCCVMLFTKNLSPGLSIKAVGRVLVLGCDCVIILGVVAVKTTSCELT